ncbi:MAG: helix-turn-helix transcriptional regulator [Muribaculaceae bacterium]|nr:helix-turn-helix transcriptional regulator [Muribaculaceae bacterium]
MDINHIFGAKVKEQRLSQKLSQEKLANMAEIDRIYLPEIEQGKRNISLSIAKRIANALNVKLTDLLAGE